MSEGGAVFVMIIAAGLFVVIGMSLEQSSWRTDCEKAGVHVSGSKAYDCKERTK